MTAPCLGLDGETTCIYLHNRECQGQIAHTCLVRVLLEVIVVEGLTPCHDRFLRART